MVYNAITTRLRRYLFWNWSWNGIMSQFFRLPRKGREKRLKSKYNSRFAAIIPEFVLGSIFSPLTIQIFIHITCKSWNCKIISPPETFTK